MLWEHAQSISNGNYGRDHGISYIGNNGTLVLHRGGWEVIADEKRMEPVPFQPILLARSRQEPMLPTYARWATYRIAPARSFHWDASKEKFKEDEANKYLAAKYCNNYTLPKV